MLGNLLIAGALFNGALKGLKEGLNPPPPAPPEHIGIWWCPQCNRWQEYKDDNPKPQCYYHKKPVTMHAHYYEYKGTL